jgi:spermidine/putrescine transport system substrate-binding protein
MGAVAGAAAIGGMPRFGSAAMSGPVNWLSWSVNAVPEIMQAFQKQHGASVNPINFEDNAEGFIKAKAGGGRQIDVAQADGTWPVQYHKAGLIEPLDMKEFASAGDLYPQFRDLKAWKTPDGKMMQYPYEWSPAGIIYVKGKVPEPTSWEALFDKKYKGRVAMNDYVEKNILLVAHMIGLSGDLLNTLTKEQLERVKKVLIEQKPLVKSYFPSSSDVVKAFAAGEVDLGYCTSSGIPLRVKDAGGPECGLFIPKMTHGWIDGNMLMKGAAHREAGKAWINFFHSAENQFTMAVKTKYPVVNQKSIKMLKDKGYGWLVEAVKMERPEIVSEMLVIGPPKDMDGWVKAWNEVKAA